jgi:GNAT superfamily N-acetyltransferase
MPNRIAGVSYRSTMAWLKVSATGLGYLSLVTSLLQRIVVANPLAVVWEAADFEWSWRVDQHANASRQAFWLNAARAPVAAVVFTDWKGELAIDVMWACEDHDEAMRTVWPIVVEKIAALDCPVDTTLVVGSPLIAAFERIGFVPTNEVSVTTTMPAASRPPVSPLPSGFELHDRTTLEAPHHMIGRSGPDIAAQLAECSLYQPELDLAVCTSEGDVVAYGLFWADPVTGVGVVEPMRTEDAYQSRGLARHVLTTGLDRLTKAGCETLMITYLADNPVSKHIYLSTGFQPQKISRSYRRPTAT